MSTILWRRLMACISLLFWLLSASAGVHAHFGHGEHHGPAADHDATHSGHAVHTEHVWHGPVVSVHSLLDDTHEEKHASGQQVDTGLEQLQSAVSKTGSKFDLSLLPLLAAPHIHGFTSVLSRSPVSSPPLKPPRHGSSAPPPLRAPPVRPA